METVTFTLMSDPDALYPFWEAEVKGLLVRVKYLDGGLYSYEVCDRGGFVLTAGTTPLGLQAAQGAAVLQAAGLSR